MANIKEIRWHGRGGQGAKTVALLFAEAAMATGKHIQAFPEYGPERMGAPVRSYDRISDEPITVHCAVEKPSVVVVLDETLCHSINVTSGLPDDGVLLINSAKAPDFYKQALKYKGSVYTVDATQIAKDEIGMNKPNTPMLGALVKVTGLLELNLMLVDTEAKLKKKFVNKPEVISGNINAIKRAYAEVKS
jgi:pyruvate ferredoxin oxidoreductase gamma subunit